MSPTGTAAPAPHHLSDAELLARHLAGDEHAFGDLVRRHQDRLWAVAVRTMRDEHDAEDALQDALVKAVGSAGRYRGEAAVTTWLHRIVVNACIDRMRRERSRPALRGLDLELVPLDAPDRADVLDVRAAVDTLPGSQRDAVTLVYLRGYPVEDAAQALGCAVGTVKSRCARARALLADRLGDRAGALVA